MILKGEVFRTPSGRAKARGRGDRFWLEAETPEESYRLEAARRVGQPTSYTGSADRERGLRGLRDLRNLAQAIAPHFREQIREIPA